MNESDNTALKEINEFVADCAKSILLNNIKADEIKNNIKTLNDQINKEINNLQKKSELQSSNEISKIVECQKTISNLLNQNACGNQTLLNELSKKLSQTNEGINALINSKSQELDNKINEFQISSLTQNENLSDLVINSTNNINQKIDMEYDYIVNKSKFLPWMTAGIYLTFVVLAAYAVVMLKNFGILNF